MDQTHGSELGVKGPKHERFRNLWYSGKQLAVNGTNCATGDQIILHTTFRPPSPAIQETLLLHVPWSFKQSTSLCWLVSLTPPDTHTQKKKHIPSLEFRKIIDSKLRFWRDMLCPRGGITPLWCQRFTMVYLENHWKFYQFLGSKLQLNFGQVVWPPLIVDWKRLKQLRFPVDWNFPGC